MLNKLPRKIHLISGSDKRQEEKGGRQRGVSVVNEMAREELSEDDLWGDT